MPNYEIYPGDIFAAIDGMGRGLTVVDSTDFYVKRTGNMLRVYRNFRVIGHMRASVSNRVLRLGELEVEKAYRSSGVSSLLIYIAILDGIRRNVPEVTLNEDSELVAYGFWARLGIQITAGRKTSLTVVLRKFEENQARLATKLGLARSPNTMLLNTDRPKKSSGGMKHERKTRGRSNSLT